MSDLPTGETPLLDILGREINQKHIAFERATLEFERSSLENARVIGRLLAQAKAEVKNQSQSWQKWLKKSCPAIKERTARLYMQVEREYDDLAATVADPDSLALLTLKEFQKRLNARNRKERQPKQNILSAPDLATDLQNAALQFEVSLDLFVANDLDAHSLEALSTILNTLASLESRINLIRKQLADRQRSSDSCPNCGETFAFGMESCLVCHWNVGEIPATSYSEDNSFLDNIREFIAIDTDTDLN
jgi:hypothetical protein